MDSLTDPLAPLPAGLLSPIPDGPHEEKPDISQLLLALVLYINTIHRNPVSVRAAASMFGSSGLSMPPAHTATLEHVSHSFTLSMPLGQKLSTQNLSVSVTHTPDHLYLLL